MSPAAIVKRRKVDEAVQSWLDGQLDFPVSVVDRPDAVPDDPDTVEQKYAIVYPIPGGEFFGSPLTAPEQDASLHYQITSVGLTWQQAQWVADEVRRVWCDRNANGALVSTLTVDGHDVIEREQVGPIGAVSKEEGVYQTVDTYEAKVSRT